DGKEVGERDLVPRHDAQSGVGGSLVDVETAPEAEHDAEQEQRKGDAGDRQQTTPLVAKGRLGDEAGDRHGSNNILHRDFLPAVETGLCPAWTGRSPVPTLKQEFFATPDAKSCPTMFAGGHPRSEFRGAACGGRGGRRRSRGVLCLTRQRV